MLHGADDVCVLPGLSVVGSCGVVGVVNSVL